MNLKHRVVTLTLLTMMTGCESADERLVDFAEQANQQQARQSQEVASAAHDLVENDAAARRELIEAQSRNQEQFRQQQATIDEQRQQLHVERREAAQAALREPVFAQAAIAIGLILAALLPLIVTAYALRRLPDSGPNDEMLTEALLEELAALPGDPPPTSPPAPRLSAPSPPGLPGQSD